MTLILDVPQPIAARWYALSEEERRRRLPALIQTLEALDADSDRENDGFPDFEEARAAIEEGIADADAGRTVPFGQFMEEARSRWKEKGVHF